jgi:hypothetical protein
VKLEGNGWLLTALVVLLLAGGLTGWFATRGATDLSPALSMTHDEPNTARLEPPCRQGAFLEASRIVNSVTDIAQTLPANTSRQTRDELDGILYTALKQARAEVHCVAGKLEYGYEKSFADIIRRGTDLAKMRGLSKDVIELGSSTTRILERNQPVPASSR